VPVIFQQPDTIANTPTLPLVDSEQNILSPTQSNGVENHTLEDDDEAEEKVKVHLSVPQSMLTAQTVQDAASAYKDPESGLTVSEGEANTIIESHLATSDAVHAIKDEISGIADTEVADIAMYEDISPESEDQVPTDTDTEESAAIDTPAAEGPAEATRGITLKSCHLRKKCQLDRKQRIIRAIRKMRMRMKLMR
jgi:hypothetical protein